MANKRGLALMSPEKRRAIASKGGKASQASGKAYRFNSETAAAAGRIGGSRRGRITSIWCWGCGIWYSKGPHVCQPCQIVEAL